MANKKLKLEVELDTAKARQKKKELESDGSSSGASVSTSTASTSRASREIKELGDAAHGAKVNMKEVTRAFAGMAVGMAANYAAKSMAPGKARDAVEYAGAATTGAAMGMMAGPIGMVVGALGGVLKTYLDKEGTKKQATADFMRGEHDYADARAFKNTLENLTEVGESFENLKTNIEETQKQLEHYRKVEQDLISKVKQFRENGNEDSAKLEEGYLSQNRNRQEALESVLKSLDKQQKNLEKSTEPRASLTATDALSKVGGFSYGGDTSGVDQIAAPSSRAATFSFGFSSSQRASTMTFGGPSSGGTVDLAIKTATERSARLDEQMADTLKTIAENTKGGPSWQ